MPPKRLAQCGGHKRGLLLGGHIHDRARWLGARRRRRLAVRAHQPCERHKCAPAVSHHRAVRDARGELPQRVLARALVRVAGAALGPLAGALAILRGAALTLRSARRGEWPVRDEGGLADDPLRPHGRLPQRARHGRAAQHRLPRAARRAGQQRRDRVVVAREALVGLVNHQVLHRGHVKSAALVGLIEHVGASHDDARAVKQAVLRGARHVVVVEHAHHAHAARAHVLEHVGRVAGAARFGGRRVAAQQAPNEQRQLRAQLLGRHANDDQGLDERCAALPADL
mmetsp:Transcript_5969/g.23606  ORF Transcript_5969/g.23606 Transcript_5969/m.23606 type:complete len:284 (-) Transcript_5969:468-1319(-)